MDTTKAMASEVKVVVAAGASSPGYNFGPRPENFGPPATVVASEGLEKKRRGRPRKYKPDESTSTAFSPTPLSPSAPPVKSYAEDKKPRPINSERKYRNKVGAEKLDESDDCLTGSSFLPHVITVNIGEDISTKIMEFSLRGPRSVCILCGNGMVSNVTIRHPSSSGGIFTYEGLFEILSLTGSFNPVEIQDPDFGRCDMMTISVAGVDGRVVGGFIGGLTVAASPIKVIVASFLLGSPSLVLKPKKQKMEPPSSGHRSGPSAHPSSTTSQNQTTNWESTQAAERSRKSSADINISLHG